MNRLRSRVFPCTKAAIDSDSDSAVALDPGDSPVVRNLQNGLLVLYVVDEGDAFQFVQRRHLSAAGLDDEDLHTAAMNNYVAFIEDRIRLQPYGGVYALFVDGNFEASLLLVDSLWDESLAEYAPHGFVAAVPARDVLAFTDATSSSGIEELRAMTSRVLHGGDHLIASDLYRRRGRGWVRFAADPD